MITVKNAPWKVSDEYAGLPPEKVVEKITSARSLKEFSSVISSYGRFAELDQVVEVTDKLPYAWYDRFNELISLLLEYYENPQQWREYHIRFNRIKKEIENDRSS